MTIKNILVHVNSDDEKNLQLNTAIELALKFGAHLCGLYVIERLNLPTYAGAYIPAGVLQAHEQAEQERAEKVKIEFSAMVEKAGCASEWHCVQGYSDQQINLFGRFADLIIVKQTQEHGVLSSDVSVEDHILLDSSRPILFVPYIGTAAPIGKHVMVAWNGSREAVRAVSDALPFLQQADSVEVVSVGKHEAQEDDSLNSVCKYLKHHDINAEASHVVSREVSVADTLLSRAADKNIDLIVMGAYGHSRLREYIFGGATHYMLEHMTIPVLMSH